MSAEKGGNVQYIYMATIKEAVNGHINSYDLGIYDSYVLAKNEVTEYITRKYINGTLSGRVLIPAVAKYMMNGGLIDEWCAKELYSNDNTRG